MKGFLTKNILHRVHNYVQSLKQFGNFFVDAINKNQIHNKIKLEIFNSANLNEFLLIFVH